MVVQPITGRDNFWSNLCATIAFVLLCHKRDDNHTQRLHFGGSFIDLEWDACLFQQDAESDASETGADNNDLGFFADRGHCLN